MNFKKNKYKQNDNVLTIISKMKPQALLARGLHFHYELIRL
jgi:hypothetical protein